MSTSNDLLPAYAGRDNSQWLPSNLILLVHHDKVCRTRLRTQCLFSVVNCPLEFLGRDKDLSKQSIYTSLARIQTRCRCNIVLVAQYKATKLVSLIGRLTRYHATYRSKVLITFRRSEKEVWAHEICASWARETTRSIPSGVEGLTTPSN